MLCWIFPRSRKARAWRRHSGLAMASHCTGFRSAARTSVPARLDGARSSMRTCRPAAPGSTSQTQPARNPCRAHNDVRGDRPVRQARRRPGQHETGQHIGLQRRQILRRHRRPRHPQISYGCQAQTRASAPSLSQQNERSRRYTFRNPEFTSEGRTRIDRARRPRYWVSRGAGGLRELWGYFLAHQAVRCGRLARIGRALGADQLEFDCDGYTDGTSGSPFLIGVDAATGDGTMIGVIGGYQQGGDLPDVSRRWERALVRRSPRSTATGASPVPAPAGGHRSPRRICPRRARLIPADCRPAGSASLSLRAAAHRGRATAHHRR